MRIVSIEARKNQSLAQKRRFNDPEIRQKWSQLMKAVCNRSEIRKIKSSAAILSCSRLDVREKMSQASRLWQNEPGVKQMMSQIQKEVQNRPEVREKHSTTAKIVNNDAEKRRKHSEFVKDLMKNEKYKEKFILACNKPETKIKQSMNQRSNWKNPRYVKKQMTSRNVRQNKSEKLLGLVLNRLYPGDWKFVGGGEVIIDGKCPDFINVNGQKKIIELFGDYWHRDENPRDRENVFKPYGYSTLVIWEHELKDMKGLTSRIHDFHFAGGCEIA